MVYVIVYRNIVQRLENNNKIIKTERRNKSRIIILYILQLQFTLNIIHINTYNISKRRLLQGDVIVTHYMHLYVGIRYYVLQLRMTRM